MAATRPVRIPQPVALHVLIALREAHARELLHALAVPHGSRRPVAGCRRHVTGRTVTAGVVATLSVLVVIALYLLVVTRLGAPLGPDPFGG